MIKGYVRVSTPEQNPQSQKDLLHAAGCEVVFEEVASGARPDRPKLAELIASLKAGDQLVVVRLDRLARSTRQLAEIVEHLGKIGVELKSLSEAIDTSTAAGRLFISVLGAVSEFERGVIADRVRAGIASARANGRVGGRPSAMSPEDVAVAKALLRDGNIAVKEVARRLGVGRSTLYRHIGGGRASA